MSTAKSILYIIPRPEIGGAERQLLMLMQGINRDRFCPHVICLDGEGSLLQDYRDASETCTVFHRQKAFDIQTLRLLTTYIKVLNPAIVHNWLYLANLYGSVAAHWANIPHIIVSQRGLGIDPQHSWLKIQQMKIANRLIASLSNQLLVNARAVAEPMFKVGFKPAHTHVIYNGLELDLHISTDQQIALRKELNIKDDQILLCAIARIDPKKDLATMLRAFALVIKKHPKARLFIVGGGFPHYQTELETLADHLNIRQSIDFLGFRNDPQAILSLCDISLLSSLTEGLPNAILESMALGKPVVATQVGGVPELIDDGIHGHLVPVGNHPLFAERICDLLDHPQKSQAMGQAGKEKAQRQFSRQAMVHNTENIYNQLLGTNPSPGPSPKRGGEQEALDLQHSPQITTTSTP